ncbi:conserved hypothetical protein [Sporisorium reilianum SRZ2]|uniref:Zn(2)-C6 fungal-type domain-containing protein n=1 Tax=Sporisorium reilianum (strain SRZ2) TaxID=999809 RepID=E7A0Z5_SPORE|nr:conserved hypothetical protein [Sporisorium reilianum SRZ2]
MGLAAGPLCVMSMDDFGFFSEASEAPYSSGSKPRSSAAQHDATQQHYYAQEVAYPLRAPAAAMPTYDMHRQRYLPAQPPPQVQPPQQHPHRLAASESGSDSAAAASAAATPAKRGSNLACLKCRAIKVKCWKSDPNDPRCSRCNRLDLFCEFREHHRGKKLEKVIADENRNVVLTPEMLTRARRLLLPCSSYPLAIDLGALAMTDSSDDAPYLALPSTSFSPVFGTSASYAASGLASAGSVSPAGMASSVYYDVVHMHAVSWTDACYLYSLYLTQLNPIAALLEPSVHTVQYTREQSPILFSTVLAIASRLFRPALHAACHAAAAAVLKFASSRQLCSVDHIHALIVGAVWAAPGDATRAEALAAAVAYAYELGLPLCFQAGMAVSAATKPYTPPLPVHLQAGHHTATLRVQQRTWLQLCLLEAAQQCDARRTPLQKRADLIAAADFPDVKTWYELNHATMSAYDTRLAYQLDFALAQRHFDRLAASVRCNAAVGESELARSIDAVLAHEAQCFSTWFRTHGDEYVPRYALDRYSNVECGFFLLLYRFGRAVQLHTLARASSPFGISALSDRWRSTATELALQVLDRFNAKLLAASSVLRLSPAYMASGCLCAARWLLPTDAREPSSTKDTARERVNETVRLLAQPQFYPDGNRVPVSGEVVGQLDLALRSLLGEAGVVAGAGASPKRARAPDVREEWGERKHRRRTSTSRGAGSNASDRAADWSPYAGGERWKGAGAGSDDAALSLDAGLGESHWPPQLLGMSTTTTGSWTPTSEGALSNIAMASTSISPPASSTSTFSVAAPAPALPDHLVGLPSTTPAPYQYATSAMSTPSLPPPNPAPESARSFDRYYVAPAYFGEMTGEMHAFALARGDTATQQAYDAAQASVHQGYREAVDLDASLSIGLPAGYQPGSGGGGGVEGAQQRHP